MIKLDLEKEKKSLTPSAFKSLVEREIDFIKRHYQQLICGAFDEKEAKTKLKKYIAELKRSLNKIK